jgi:pimeloyl-ACP methyl ester carboxylesterase
MKKILIAIVLILILVPLGWAFLRPSTIIPHETAKKRFAVENSKFVNWRGAEIHYIDEGEGIPLVMIHGYGGSHRNFRKIAEILKKDFRVIRVDLPGFGLSQFPESYKNSTNLIQLYRDYMTFVLDTLQLDSVYLMGNSMGGWMAWETATENEDRVKKLVLMCSAGYEMDKVSENAAALLKKKYVQRVFSRGMPLYFQEDGAKKCYYDPGKINAQEVVNNNALWNKEGNIEAAFRVAGANEKADTTRIARVACPTLIIWGKDDQIIPSEHAYKFQEAIAGSQLIMYEKCGHIPMIENAEQTAKDFLEFAKGNGE